MYVAKLTGRDVVWDFHTVTTGYNKGVEGICDSAGREYEERWR